MATTPSPATGMTADSSTRGRFVWHELMTTDPTAAQKFYSDVVGWGVTESDMPGMKYTMFTAGEIPIGGLIPMMGAAKEMGAPPNWTAYIEVPNCDDTIKQAESLGGRTLVPATDIPGVGRFAVLQDPQGAVFGALKPGTPGGAWDGTPVVGRFSWHELMTTDYVKAFEFYRDLFGWEKTSEMDMGGGQNYFMYGKGDKAYGGMFNRFGDMESMNPFWLVYVHVKDVGTAVTAATKGGGMVHRPQMDIPGGSIAILGDPQGAGFALHHVSAPAAAEKPAATKSAATKSAATTAKKTAKVAKKAVKKAVKKAAKVVKKAAKKAATKVKSVAKKAAKSPPRAKSKAKAKKKARPAARKPNAKKATRATAKRGKKAARKR
jgi:predicted enzyme related to lactoylglutathione lyase